VILDELLSLYNELLNQRTNLDPRIIEGVLFGLGMLNIDQPDVGIDLELFQKLSPKDSIDWENKKALAFALTFVSSNKLKKKILGIAKDYSNESLANVKKIGGLMLSFHETEKDLLKKYFSKPEKTHRAVLQGLFLGCSLQRYTQFIPVLENIIVKEKNEFHRLDFVFSYIILGLYNNPAELATKLMEMYETESKIIRRIILESLSLLVAFIDDFQINLDILSYLCRKTRMLDQYGSETTLILMLMLRSKSEISEIWTKVSEKTTKINEFKLIKEKWEELSEAKKFENPMEFLDNLLKSEYHDIKLSTLYASFFVDDMLDKSDTEVLANVITSLVNYRVAYVRDIAISRLLSFSLKYKTLDYLEYFTNQLSSVGNVNEQLYLSIAWGVLSEFGGKTFQRVYDESKVFQNSIIQKGVLIGLGIASNQQINIDWMDEKFLGYYEVFKGNLEHALIFLFLSHFLEQKQEKKIIGDT
jgi:hypothetical protein